MPEFRMRADFLVTADSREEALQVLEEELGWIQLPEVVLDFILDDVEEEV